MQVYELKADCNYLVNCVDFFSVGWVLAWKITIIYNNSFFCLINLFNFIVTPCKSINFIV